MQPLIEAEYHTNNHRTIIGQSLGGLLVAEIAIKQPALFTNYIIISPSLWWDKESLLPGKNRAIITEANSRKIYLAVGREGKIMVNDSRRLLKYFQQDNVPSSQLRYEYFKDEDHASIMHLAVYNAFKFFKKVK